MMRREFIGLVAGSAMALPFAAEAQQPDGTPLIAFLFAGASTSNNRYLETFREAMHELGYDEGRNIRFEYRYAEGYLDRLPGLAAELISLKPSVVVTSPLPASLAAFNATKTIPIVMGNGADPVGFGLVESLSHPGGNVTGVTNFSETLVPKQFDFLRQLLPKLARVGMLVNTINPLHVPQLKEMQIATRDANVDLVTVELRAPDDLEGAFATLASQNVDALFVPPDAVSFQLRKQIAQLAASYRLPAVYGYREHVIEGGLMSYGPDLSLNFRRAPTYVDKILKGASPANLPIERPNKIELLINIKTAKALGIDIPPSLLALADAVIE